MVLESEVDEKIKEEIKDFAKCSKLWDIISKDEEIFNILEQANKVSIVRMGFNDHGRVHAKIVLLNALKIYKILESKGINGNIITDGIGDSEDVRVALMLAAYLHDIGMSVSRKSHDIIGAILAKDIVTRVLNNIYNDIGKIARIRSLIFECILCHLGEYTSTSLESKIIATADGTDMTKGRARIPYKISKPDIHKFSALSIENVEIKEGVKKPIRIIAEMNDTTGIFQIEAQLMQKIRDVGFSDYVEIVAKIKDGREFSYW
jgi:metal-dependent HD superfamily phosphatase/phosphodiesterase